MVDSTIKIETMYSGQNFSGKEIGLIQDSPEFQEAAS